MLGPGFQWYQPIFKCFPTHALPLHLPAGDMSQVGECIHCRTKVSIKRQKARILFIYPWENTEQEKTSKKGLNVISGEIPLLSLTNPSLQGVPDKALQYCLWISPTLRAGNVGVLQMDTSPPWGSTLLPMSWHPAGQWRTQRCHQIIGISFL